MVGLEKDIASETDRPMMAHSSESSHAACADQQHISADRKKPRYSNISSRLSFTSHHTQLVRRIPGIGASPLRNALNPEKLSAT